MYRYEIVQYRYTPIQDGHFYYHKPEKVIIPPLKKKRKKNRIKKLVKKGETKTLDMFSTFIYCNTCMLFYFLNIKSYVQYCTDLIYP